MRKAFLAFLAIALVAALATAQSGLILPAGSNTLKSIHFKDYPALGVYMSSAGTMYVGGTSGGISLTDTAASLSALTFTGNLTGDGVVISDNGIYPVDDDTGKYLGASTLKFSTLYLARGIQGGHTKAFTDEIAADIALVNVSAGSGIFGTLIYGAISNSTNTQAVSGRATFACVNVADTEACDLDMLAAESTITDAGTLACTPSIDTDETNAVMFVMTCDSEAGDQAGVVYWRFDNLLTTTVSPQ